MSRVHEEKAILFGECIWDADEVDPKRVTDLIDRGNRAVPGSGWQVHYALFSRAGFSEATRALATEQGVRLVDLATMDADLKAAFPPPEEESDTAGEGETGEGEGEQTEGGQAGEAEEGPAGEG